jgi:hypothetical protein
VSGRVATRTRNSFPNLSLRRGASRSSLRCRGTFRRAGTCTP